MVSHSRSAQTSRMIGKPTPKPAWLCSLSITSLLRSSSPSPALRNTRSRLMPATRPPILPATAISTRAPTTFPRIRAIAPSCKTTVRPRPLPPTIRLNLRTKPKHRGLPRPHPATQRESRQPVSAGLAGANFAARLFSKRGKHRYCPACIERAKPRPHRCPHLASSDGRSSARVLSQAVSGQRRIFLALAAGDIRTVQHRRLPGPHPETRREPPEPYPGALRARSVFLANLRAPHHYQ